MNQVEVISKALKAHRIRPELTQIDQDLDELDPEDAELDQDSCYQRELVQKCLGCPWVGFDHRQHRAEEVSKALDEARWITNPGELRALNNDDRLNGALIKCVGIVNPESGRYDCGEVYEQNDDGTWGILCTPGYNGWEDRAVPAEDLALPALLLWEPVSEPARQQ